MASLKSIRKRISSVKSTQKITKAMKMVAAAKLRRAQFRAIEARAYTQAAMQMAGRAAVRAGVEAHPLFRTGSVQTPKELWILSSDRGLCGGFNSNLLRRAGDFLEKGPVQCRVVGKKGRDFFRARGWKTEEVLTGFYDNLDAESLRKKAEEIAARFASGQTGEVWIAYNRFQSAMVQVVTFEKLLPLSAGGAQEKKAPVGVDYLYEPERFQVLDWLCKEALTAALRQALFESQAAELAARMTAMESATSNASDMISYLTLQYNRVRQATITRELMDIVGGAEALS